MSLAVAAVLVIAATGVLAESERAGAVPDASRQRELIVLLRQDCGSCHGMRLTGGLGPALTSDALRDRPVRSIAATIIHGRAGTPMPPWRRFLTDAEADWLATRLVSGTFDAR